MMKTTKNTLLAEERRRRIAEYICNRKNASVSDLCEKFGASPATIRNDLNELDSAGMICRTHGGALGISQVSYENLFSDRVSNQAEKQAIANCALSMIYDNDTILLDQRA